MDDIKLLEICPKCGGNITLMESINMDTQELCLVKRCLSCGNYPVTEVVILRVEPCGFCEEEKIKWPQTKFEAWKKGLTLEEFAVGLGRVDASEVCEFCPASHYCPPYPNRLCEQNIKEWGESNADK